MTDDQLGLIAWLLGSFLLAMLVVVALAPSRDYDREDYERHERMARFLNELYQCEQRGIPYEQCRITPKEWHV